MEDSGLYVLWLKLRTPLNVQVGSLGTLHFDPGLYAYVGSAQKNRAARIARHLRLEKPLRWHIDYLRPHVEVVDVTCREGTREGECRLVEELIQSFGARRSHPGFGASDCKCDGHLLLFPRSFDIITKKPPDQEAPVDTKDRLYEALAEICKALSHPKRLEILDILRHGEAAVETIAQKTGMQKSNLSQHLSVLRKAHLVTTRRQGLNIFYALANPAILEASDILRKVLLDSWAESGSIASSIRE